MPVDAAGKRDVQPSMSGVDRKGYIGGTAGCEYGAIIVNGVKRFVWICGLDDFAVAFSSWICDVHILIGVERNVVYAETGCIIRNVDFTDYGWLCASCELNNVIHFQYVDVVQCAICAKNIVFVYIRASFERLPGLNDRVIENLHVMYMCQFQ